MIRNDRMRILTWDGVVDDVHVVTDGAASLIGSHWNAVRRYLWTGDTSVLAPFEGALINFHRLLTDPDRIDEWAQVGELEIDYIYESGGGR